MVSQHSTSLAAAELHLWLEPDEVRVGSADHKGGVCVSTSTCVISQCRRQQQERGVRFHGLRARGRFYTLLQMNINGAFHYKAISVFSLPAESTIMKKTFKMDQYVYFGLLSCWC